MVPVIVKVTDEAFCLTAALAMAMVVATPLERDSPRDIVATCPMVVVIARGADFMAVATEETEMTEVIVLPAVITRVARLVIPMVIAKEPCVDLIRVARLVIPTVAEICRP